MQYFTQHRGKWGLFVFLSRLKRRKGTDTYENFPMPSDSGGKKH